MLLFLRFLIDEIFKLSETEADRIRHKKVKPTDNISIYECLLNYDFKDPKLNSCLKIDKDNEIVIEWDDFNNGKRWTERDLNALDELCFEEKSILEFLTTSGRNIGPLLKKLNELDWHFEFEDGLFKLTQYEKEPIYDPSEEVKYHRINTSIYYPRSFFYGVLKVKQDWISTKILLEFEYPLPDIDKDELTIEFSQNNDLKNIEINKDLSSYLLYEGSNEVFNSPITLRHKELGELSLELKESKNYEIRLLSYLISNESN